jgi:hypothetical protein
MSLLNLSFSLFLYPICSFANETAIYFALPVTEGNIKNPSTLTHLNDKRDTHTNTQTDGRDV